MNVSNSVSCFRKIIELFGHDSNDWFGGILVILISICLLLLEFLGVYNLSYPEYCVKGIEMPLFHFVFMITIVCLFEFMALSVVVKYEIDTSRFLCFLMILPITLFLLPNFIMKKKQHQKLEIIRQVMEL